MYTKDGFIKMRGIFSIGFYCFGIQLYNYHGNYSSLWLIIYKKN